MHTRDDCCCAEGQHSSFSFIVVRPCGRHIHEGSSCLRCKPARLVKTQRRREARLLARGWGRGRRSALLGNGVSRRPHMCSSATMCSCTKALDSASTCSSCQAKCAEARRARSGASSAEQASHPNNICSGTFEKASAAFAGCANCLLGAVGNQIAHCFRMQPAHNPARA